MKQLIALFVFTALLLCGCAQEIKIDESTIVTRTGTVTDHAMASEGTGKIWDASYPYLSVEFEDGTGICIWNKTDVDYDVEIGDTVEVTYGLQQNIEHWILINIKDTE